MAQDRITYLFNRYFEGTATYGEIEELKLMFSADSDEALRVELLVLSVLGVGEDYPEVEPGSIYAEAYDDELRRPGVIRMYKRYWYAAAAVIIFLIAGAAWFFRSAPGEHGNGKPVLVAKNDVPPGGDRATLTLADGRTLVLDSAQDGTLAKEGITTINLLGGEITYANHHNLHQTGKDLLKNTLTTPRGGEFKLVLPDGSHVWLNAASTLRFPSQFTGDVREVELTGEAYFSIASNAKAPFYVKTATTRIQVLGTEFNVNAYSEESAVRTTLLGGSVRVSSAAAGSLPVLTLRKPGQQAATTEAGNTMKEVDAQAVAAWKDGMFSFEKATIGDIMRQLSRWYNVEVIYEGQPSGATYMIGFPRRLSLATALDILGKLNVHTRINDNKQVVVTP
ncbi:FecR family protein [Filimonas effusa]|uniref:DUF4974 domain-containing protein n=1 Tax=Filimonas effusa TaxID=2508721 RepID=A0A4Q1D1M4_9BACT|nr:FecR family protein [Filimonas effusa]RXK81756.1 DUF4974 domain-containing protein [Filimonas effusa]